MDDVRDESILRIVMGFRFSSIRRLVILYIFVIQIVPVAASRPARAEPIIFDQAAAQKLLGQHTLTLRLPGSGASQVVGKAEITKADNGDWHLTARQSSKNTRIELDGLIIEVDAISFKFNGKVVMRIDNLADGKACSRNGPFTFVEDGDSAQEDWRLLQAGNPCGTAIDSVDLYLH